MGVTVSSNTTYHVTSGQTDTGDIVLSGGTMYVDSGGTASGAAIDGGGFAIVEAGGTDFGAQISGGEQDVFGLASGATVFTGSQVVKAGGTANTNYAHPEWRADR
jgi:autotransporter passenger strand-loop-strand repeat protein